MNKAVIINRFIVIIFLLALAGCAFDVIHVKQEPAELVSVEPPKDSWVLVRKAIIELGTGYKRKLKAGTTWDYAGSIKQGEVYKTDDQILTIEHILRFFRRSCLPRTRGKRCRGIGNKGLPLFRPTIIRAQCCLFYLQAREL
jgi:hypothetical protein